MPEIKKIYRQSLPEMKFVGRCYGESEKVNGNFGSVWDKWFKENLFAPLELKGSGEQFFDDNAYYGLCRCKQGEPFQYWIGVFMPTSSAVPDGYDSVNFDAGDIAVCWIYGKEPDIYFHCCLDEMKKSGYEWTADKNGVKWCFEKYVCPRFTTPDEKGNVILDMCYYIKP